MNKDEIHKAKIQMKKDMAKHKITCGFCSHRPVCLFQNLIDKETPYMIDRNKIAWLCNQFDYSGDD